MITYSMQCPIHMGSYIKSDTIITTVQGQRKPIFLCEKCKRYYMHSDKKEGIKYATYGNVEIITTNEKYYVESDRDNDNIWKTTYNTNRVDKNASSTNKATTSLNANSRFVDNIVRIKRVEDSDIKSAKGNLLSLRNQYPNVVTEKMSVYDFMVKVLGANIEKSCAVKNTSFNGKKGLVRKVEFYCLNSTYLKNKLPNDIYVAFGGKLTKGEFVIDEIRVINSPDIVSPYMAKSLRFAYDGPNNSNWFYEITNEAAEQSDELTGELASWNDYLNWRRQLAELKIKGLKYVSLKINYDERRMVFLVVSEGVEQLNEFRKFINRNEISAFSNNYSKNRWYFDFNRDYQDNQDSGVELSFMEYGERFHGNAEVRDSDWSNNYIPTKKYKDDEKRLSFREIINGIDQNYFDPIYQELYFELTDRATNIIRRDIRRNGSITDQTEKSTADEFYGDGYLATSQIGDFALLSRLQRGIEDLANGKSAQQSLGDWLFDINKADVPLSINPINSWQNPSINEKQKRAVEKILSAPDVCLIQGPPGTGKTTVIAEAIYQLVVRNKRVLVASQANLAVDNALERLISNPKIRAIRLGNAKKIDVSVRNITEENVLETFYNSIIEYIQKGYLDKWVEIDKTKNYSNKIYQKYLEYDKKKEDLEDEINIASGNIEKIATFDGPDYYKNLLSDKMSMMLILSFCDDNSSEMEVFLSRDRIINLWNVISKYITNLKNKGIILTKIGININELDGLNSLDEANRIIKHTLINLKAAYNLCLKKKNEDIFGNESEELEHLKLLEKELRADMMSNPEKYSEWLKVSQEIKEFSNSGRYGLSENEESIFVGIENTNGEVWKDTINKSLDASFDDLKCLISEIKKKTKSELANIEEEIKSENKKREEADIYSKQIKDKISNLKEEFTKIEGLQNSILTKYEATPENLKNKIVEKARNHIDKLDTPLNKNVWQDIFVGLKDWVKDIPDYSQEKEIFLKNYINGCNVVGVSCTESARTFSENGFNDFDVVIIDEVSKATPPELLIPMLRGRKVVLVGDHRQLPPLFNEHEKSYEEMAKIQEDNDDLIVQLTTDDFEKYRDMVTASLFEQYFENADNNIKETLTYQYRMHSDIMDLINMFYDGFLHDGNEDDYTEDTKAHYLSIYSNFGTEMIIPERHAYWFDSSQLSGERVYEYRRPQSSSCENIVEAETILELLRKMELQYANMTNRSEPVSVGVISFYFDQVSLIRNKIRQETFHAIDVEVNTVDRFQGKEKEIIFVSLVRNRKNHRHSIDSFIAAYQRINVAFSRAQNLLIIVGATDMYTEQPVKITDMNNGEEKVIYPYRHILELMNTKGTYFTCDEVIPETKVDDILLNIERQKEERE